MPEHEPRHEIVRHLLSHFDAHRRAMPWRETSDPYAIWVSEVMLQQTRVDTVIPYYQRWLERFPTVEALAEAELDEVLKAWEGLGYYSRARNLHRAARLVRERHGGRVPKDPGDLRDLPGVGEYTTGAVASIAFGVPLPAVDGNVRRVLARLYDLEAPGAADLRRRAAELVPDDRPGDFNQALMELGATICTPRAPACGRCPLSEACLARRRGVPELRPKPPARGPIPTETVRTTVLLRGGDPRADSGRRALEVLLIRRPSTGLLGGLWEFPGGEVPPDVDRAVRRSERLAELPAVRHVFSHKRVEYRPEVRAVGEADAGPAGDDAAWIDPREASRFALPVAQQKVARLLLDWLREGADA